ncbi:Uncharacterized conserved protein (DUF2183) [Seminavis robusta]|uniref:Uncharacterized conserved protein (DUF2183) n=1 Tax=Seminavis robusta TaxID=568900 RepID=A0A9N8EM76_9STRA|nr:Uncharacterized conserved protein (DUF2183) [Seminavis robusta]|eukprot:Sro1323_g262640.1 Uncharacterized conserved protein (DUF2183) (435) ;mRNA; r:8027-9440
MKSHQTPTRWWRLMPLALLLASHQSSFASALISRGSSTRTVDATAATPTKIAGSPPSASNNDKKKRKSRRARIKHDEKVVFFPTAARRSEDGKGWDIPIHGWIYEPETRDPARRAIVASLRKYLGLKREEEETKILKRRLGTFLVNNERRKELAVQMGCSVASGESCRVFPLPQSKKNGHFQAMLQIDDQELAAIQEATCDEKNTLHFQAIVEDGDDRVFEGMSHLIPNEGVSVISDIDDTVKITGVGNKKALLRSTFMEEFKQVPGMAELYQEWAEDLDCKFHFVSSSPWQLWEELAGFLSDIGFPHATYHLKPIRLKDRTLFDLWKCPLETKIEVIESILDSFPQRKFILVGDTGEKDPEVYGEIARRYPNQIQGLYVRNVTGETGKEERYDEAWVGVNREICHLFTEPQDIQLPASLTTSPPTNAKEALKP